jgi:hypothetical protein
VSPIAPKVHIGTQQRAEKMDITRKAVTLKKLTLFIAINKNKNKNKN